MLVFPQLVTGASALYPVLKRRVKRTAVNVLGDGSKDVFSDTDAALIAWEMRATGLTAAEWRAIESLFLQTSGMWQTFTFLDPTGNLLANSEQLSASPWTHGALVQLTAGVADPLGTLRATTIVNAGQTTDGVSQTLAVPGNFQYCVSAWVRSSAGSSVTLVVGAGSQAFPASAVWKRVSFTANAASSASTVTFALHLAAGAAADIFGLQVEAQPGPSDYQTTGAGGGVYSNARFASDRLTVRAQGTDVYDAVIRIVSREN
ncbi:MAG TPA: hypothetical protein VGR73_01860 [Bryobacteraceae bacterium]|nr:hypothetical protein [Bryobacteraceae bacterium]